MLFPYILLSLTGLALFYFQNLVLFPHVHLRLLSLLVFATALRPSLALAFTLAIFLGVLQDSYALTPFGLHVSGALLLVTVARLARRQFILANLEPQFLASLAALSLEEVWLRGAMFMLGNQSLLLAGGATAPLLEIICTCALAPLMSAWLERVEKTLRRQGWRPARSSL